MENKGSYIRGLDGLRAFAATIVFAYHLWGHWNYQPVILGLGGLQFDLTWIFHFGTEGVSIFFVLSGFLLSQPFWKAVRQKGRPVNLRQFFKHRFLRIYPAYLVALVIFALFYDNQDAIAQRLALFISHLFLVHNLFEMTIFRLSSPLWSVATEFQMYLALPLVFAAIALMLRDKGRAGIAAAVLFVAAGLFGVAFYADAKIWFAGNPVNPNWIRASGDVLPHLPFVGMAYFASGIAFGYLYQWLQEKRRAGLAWHPALPELAGAGAALLIVPLAVAQPILAGVSTEIWPRLALFYGLLVTAVALGGQVPGLTRLLEWGPIRWLGMISYSFYLYHDFALHLAFHRLPDLWIGSLVPDGVVKGVVAFAATLVVSAASYYLIESRFHGAARRKTEMQPAVAAVEQAESKAAPASTRLSRQDERASVRIDPR